MARFLFEDFVHPDDLDADGRCFYNANVSYALNALGKALRQSTIQGKPGLPLPGPYGQPQNYVEFRSPFIWSREVVDWTRIGQTVWESKAGWTLFYVGDDFQGAGYYEGDETVNGKTYQRTFVGPRKFRNGVPDETGTYLPPEQCPAFDLTGCSGNQYIRLSWYGQNLPQTGQSTNRPSRVPGAAVLVTGLERAKTLPNGSVGWDGTGGDGGSNDNTFVDCTWNGHWHGPAAYLLNAILTNFERGGISLFNNVSTARAISSTQFPVAINMIAPSPIGTPGVQHIQSPFYPNVPSPSVGDQRFLCSPSAAGAIDLYRFGIHTQPADTYGPLPGDGQSQIMAPVLLHKSRQLSVRGGILGHDGQLALIEAYGLGSHLKFDGTEFWNVDRHNRAKQRAIVYLHDTYYPDPNDPADVHAHQPFESITFDDCVMNGIFYPGAHYIEGRGGSAIRNLEFRANNTLRGDVGIARLNPGWSDPNANFLENAVIYAKGSPITVGGTLRPTVKINQPGAITAGIDQHSVL